MVTHGVTVVLIGLHTVAEEGESGGEMDQGGVGRVGDAVGDECEEAVVEVEVEGGVVEADTVVGVEEAVCTAA